jgi:hypothetical protein
MTGGALHSTSNTFGYRTRKVLTEVAFRLDFSIAHIYVDVFDYPNVVVMNLADHKHEELHESYL